MTEKVRVHEIAKELGITSKDVVKKASDMGVDVKSANSSVTMQEAESLMNYIMSGELAQAPKPETKTAAKTTSDTQKKETTPEEETLKSEDDKTDVKQEKNAKKETIVKDEKVDKKEETIKIAKEDKSTLKAEEKEPLEKSHESISIEEPKKMQIKRSGLKIVKKKKQPQESEKTQEYTQSSKQKQTVSTYGKISADVLEELAKKKKTKQSAGARKQEQGVKIDIFGGSLSEVSMDMDDQVVLLDLNSTERHEIVAEEPRKPKPPKPIGRNANKKAAPRGRKVSRDKRKKYAKDKPEDIIVTHVEIPEDIRVYEFAEKLNRPITDVIKVLFGLGLMMTKNDFLGHDEIEILSEEFGVEVTIVDPKDAFNYEED
ncbi:translation initiation factor IF-2 N-terminal domain-containing protein, partial [Sulfurimonas sp.]|uniref:translation initiation factor IF-2 N-terminal domain-containing protein n=1 Tax=Sulfurimonas sp. TaxID=2022749 RepID=UPI0025CD4E46